MPMPTVSALVEALRKSHLVASNQLDELMAEVGGRCADARALTQEMLRRNLLTPYQANQIFTTGGRDLILGPYILLAKIGEGIMGQVYKARHRLMDRYVALKVIRPELLARPDAVEQFYKDTQAAGQLSHPNIVHAYDSGPIGNTHFFAMEYVEGVDLEKQVQQAGPLSVPLACDFMRQTAQGLQHAFERGVLHRDLKPSNLLITRPGSATSGPGKPGSGPKLMPSGQPIVKIRNLGLTLLQPLPEAELARVASGIQGKALTSPDYLAPERAQGRNPGDVRSDLYSLGCTFYFVLSGRVPFSGGTAAEKLRRHQSEEPAPLTALRRDVPTAVVSLIGKLMAKRPDARPATPGDVANLLPAS